MTSQPQCSSLPHAHTVQQTIFNPLCSSHPQLDRSARIARGEKGSSSEDHESIDSHNDFSVYAAEKRERERNNAHALRPTLLEPRRDGRSIAARHGGVHAPEEQWKGGLRDYRSDAILLASGPAWLVLKLLLIRMIASAAPSATAAASPTTPSDWAIARWIHVAPERASTTSTTSSATATAAIEAWNVCALRSDLTTTSNAGRARHNE